MEDQTLLANTKESSRQRSFEHVIRTLKENREVKRVSTQLSGELMTLLKSEWRFVPGKILGIELREDTFEAAEKFIRSARIFRLGFPDNNERSYIAHPGTSVLSDRPAYHRRRMGISDSFTLICVGTEPVEILIRDLERALETVDHTRSWKKLF